jgi:hypothetical protein
VEGGRRRQPLERDDLNPTFWGGNLKLKPFGDKTIKYIFGPYKMRFFKV